MKKVVSRFLALVMALLLVTCSALAEDVSIASITDAQKLDAAYTLAVNAINSEDYETAKEYLSICFVYCDPQNNPIIYADLLLKRACINYIDGKNDMALMNLEAALRLQPDLANAYLVRMQVYAAQGENEAAIESLERYIELSGETALYENVAQMWEEIGQIEAAQEAYAKYVESTDGEVVEAGFQSGEYMMRAGKLEEAIAAFEAYAEDETYGAGAMYYIGVCKMNLGDFSGAIEAFNACEEKGGQYDGIKYYRGYCSLQIGQLDDAAADLVASIETESFQEDASLSLAICRMQQEDYETAIAIFTALIGDEESEEKQTDGQEANDVEKYVVYYLRAACQMELGNLEAALEDYTVCIDHGYELALCYSQRALIYEALGDTENQNKDLQEFLKLAN